MNAFLTLSLVSVLFALMVLVAIVGADDDP